MKKDLFEEEINNQVNSLSKNKLKEEIVKKLMEKTWGWSMDWYGANDLAEQILALFEKEKERWGEEKEELKN